jgi:hypothetical protein
MYSELKSYIRSCDSCQRNNSACKKPIGLLKQIDIQTVSFEQVSMDFTTTLPQTKAHHDAVMSIVEKLTKLVMFIPTRTDIDTGTTAKLFFNHWHRWFGLPKKKKYPIEMDGLLVRSEKISSDSRRRSWQRLQATTLRQMDKQKKRVEIWRKLSETTSTTKRIIGTTN